MVCFDVFFCLSSLKIWSKVINPHQTEKPSSTNSWLTYGVKQAEQLGTSRASHSVSDRDIINNVGVLIKIIDIDQLSIQLNSTQLIEEW